MNFFEKAGILFDYIIIACIKNWRIYRRIISKIERRNSGSVVTDHDLINLRTESEMMIKKLVVFLPFKSTCIQRSITIYRYFARKGVMTDFIVGIRLAPYSFHCWLMCGGEVVFDSPPDSKYYQMKTFKISEYLGNMNDKTSR